MQFADFEIHASPNFQNVHCPKHGDEMVELDNGWFSVCWYCEKCQYPYEIRLMKMMKVNKENLQKALDKHKNKKDGTGL